MRRVRGAILLASLPFAFAFAAPAQPVGFMLEGSWFRVAPKVSVQLPGTTPPGAPAPDPSSVSIDSEADLGVQKTSTFPVGLRLIRPGYRIEAEYFAPGSAFSGDAVALRPLVFQGVAFLLGEAVHTDLKVRDWSGHFRYDIWSGPYASLGAGVDVDYFRFEASVASPVKAATDSRNVTIPTATAALNFHDSGSQIYLDGKFSYMSYTGTKCEKIRAEIGYLIMEGLGIKGGWRSTHVTYTRSNDPGPEDRFDVKLDGFYAGAFLEF